MLLNQEWRKWTTSDGFRSAWLNVGEFSLSEGLFYLLTFPAKDEHTSLQKPFSSKGLKKDF